MNTSPSSSSTANGGTTAAANAQGATAQRRHGHPAATGGDLFANLLALLNAGGEAAPEGLLSTTSPATPGQATDDPAQDDSAGNTAQNPLAALLAWSGAPLPAGTGPFPRSNTTEPSLPSGNSAMAADAAAIRGDRLAGSARADTAETDASAVTVPDPATAFTEATATAVPSAPHRTTHGARAGTGTGAAHPTITGWRSTTTLAHAGSAAAGAGHTARAAADSPASTAARPDPGAAPATLAPTTPADTEAQETRPVAGPAERNASGAEAATASTAATTTGGDGMGGGTEDPSGQPGQNAARAEEPGTPPGGATPEDTDTAHWTSPHVRHASVRVGDAGEAPIDIQLSLDGQAVQVSFQTDDALARDSLAQDAQAALGELLQRSGIALEAVSVGGQSLTGQQTAQQQPGGQPMPRHGAPAGMTTRASGDAAPVGSAPAPVRAPREDGSRPLDVFA